MSDFEKARDKAAKFGEYKGDVWPRAGSEMFHFKEGADWAYQWCQERNSALRNEFQSVLKRYVKMSDENEALEAENAKLRDALELYAEPANWIERDGDSHFNAYLNDDEESEGQGYIGGHLARKALAETSHDHAKNT